MTAEKILVPEEGFEPSVPFGTPDFECGRRSMHYAATRMDIGPMWLRTVRHLRGLHLLCQKIPNKSPTKKFPPAREGQRGDMGAVATTSNLANKPPGQS